MKERPILFSGPMVRAILDGRKTQTRRMVKPQPAIATPGCFDVTKCPYGVVGDRIWVRETWATRVDCEPGTEKAKRYTMYKASGGNPADPMNWHDFGGRWRPSIHMPRWASRITLEIVSIRVERLQEISEEDAKAEGVEAEPLFDTASPQGWMSWKASFARLWDSIYGNRPALPHNTKSARYARVKRWLDKNPPQGWDANPYVWVVEFRRVEK